MMSGRGRRRALLLATLLVGTATLVPSAAAHAQEGPYGSTTTEAPPEPNEVTCSLDITTGEAGSPGTAQVFSVQAGVTVRLLFDGAEVGSAEALGAPGTSSNVTIGFTVPEVDPGSYVVAAVGPSFAAECDGSLEVGAVAGENIVRPGTDPSGNVAGSGSGRVGPLPRTGVYIALLVVIALAALILGRILLAASRRRRRRLSRPTDLTATVGRHRS